MIDVVGAIDSIKDAEYQRILSLVYINFEDFRSVKLALCEVFDNNFERCLTSVRLSGGFMLKHVTFEARRDYLEFCSNITKEYQQIFGNVPFSVALHKAMKAK